MCNPLIMVITETKLLTTNYELWQCGTGLMITFLAKKTTATNFGMVLTSHCAKGW